MVSLLAVVSLIMFVCSIKSIKTVKRTRIRLMILVSGVVFIICLVWMAILFNTVRMQIQIDNRIAMYEQENREIEKNVENILRNQFHFQDKKYTGEKAVEIAKILPEIKEDSSIQKELFDYYMNNHTIEALREQKKDLSCTKWQLYFGR